LKGILGSNLAVPSFDSLKQTSDLPSPLLQPIAHFRHQPLSSVKHLMLDRIERLDLFSGTADEAAEHLLLSFMALDALFLDDDSRLNLLGELAKKGMALAESTELGEDGAGMLDFALQGVVVRSDSATSSMSPRSSPYLQRSEIRQSVVLGVPSQMCILLSRSSVCLR
jgi:hypothetical protein